MKDTFLGNIRQEFRKLPKNIKIASLASLALIVLLLAAFQVKSLIQKKDDTTASQVSPSASASTTAGMQPSYTGTAVPNPKKLFADQPAGNISGDIPGTTMSDDQRNQKYNPTDLKLNDKGLPIVSDTKDPNRFAVDFARAMYTFDTTKATYDEYINNLVNWTNLEQKYKNQSKDSNIKYTRQNIMSQLNTDMHISSSDDWKRLSLQNTKYVGRVTSFVQPPYTGTGADINPNPDWLKFNTKTFGVVSVTAFETSGGGQQTPGLVNSPDSGHTWGIFVDCPNDQDTNFNKQLFEPFKQCLATGWALPTNIKDGTSLYDSSNQ